MNRQILRGRGMEELEPRLLMAVAPEEQLFVYLLNRARHDPVAYQQENNLAIDLSYVARRGPLAVNNDLYESAEFHAQEMAIHNYFGHQSTVTGQWPNQMARNAGYVLPSQWINDANYIESLAAGTFYSTASQPLNALIVDQGVPSLGHRNHLLGIDSFNADNREIGVGHALNANAQYDHYWAIHATRTNANDRFLTGVAFADTNANSRYDLNEGLANVTITAGGFTTTTNAAGGWSIKVPQGSYVVTATGAGFSGIANAITSVTSDNVEVDFISGNLQGMVNFQAPPPPAVSLTIADASTLEGSGGTTNLVFVVTLSGLSSLPVQVSYRTAGGTAAVASDFQPTAGVLSFAPGTVTQRVTVPVFADLLVEGSESFMVELSNPVGASLVDGQAAGTILNDDTSYARPNEILVVAPGPGRDSTVRVLDRATGAERFRVLVFPGFQGGVQVALGDVSGDGVLDIIAAAGPGGGPHVRVLDGVSGSLVQEFYAYHPTFSGGVFVAAGHFNGDARADIVTAPGGGGGPHVRIFSGAGGLLGEYYAFAPAFGGGVRVAVGDIDGNGTNDVVTAAGPGGGPHVRVFSGASTSVISGPLANFYAYGATFGGGVYVAAGDVNGDGRTDLIAGAGAGGGPHVRAFSGLTGLEVFGIYAYAPAFSGGVRVGVVDANGDGRAEIVTAAGFGGGPHVRVFDAVSRNEVYGLYAFEPTFSGGVYLGGSVSPGSGGGSGNLSALLSADAPPADATSLDVAKLASAASSPARVLAARHPQAFASLFEDVNALWPEF